MRLLTVTLSWTPALLATCCRHSNGTCDDSSDFRRIVFDLLPSLHSGPAHCHANAPQAKCAVRVFRRGRCPGACAPPRPDASRVESKTSCGEELVPGWVFVSSCTRSRHPFNLLTPDACSAQWITRTRLAQVAPRACCSRRRRRLLLPPPRHPSRHADAALIRFPHLLSTGGWLSV